MYITPKELTEIILESQQAKCITERLALLVDKMVRALNSRYHFVSRDEEDDAAQNGVVLIAMKINRCDVNKHAFNWITTCLANMLKQHARSLKHQYFTAKNFATFLSRDGRGDQWSL